MQPFQDLDGMNSFQDWVLNHDLDGSVNLRI